MLADLPLVFECAGCGDRVSEPLRCVLLGEDPADVIVWNAYWSYGGAQPLCARCRHDRIRHPELGFRWPERKEADPT
jgi:hypothetical protein